MLPRATENDVAAHILPTGV